MQRVFQDAGDESTKQREYQDAAAGKPALAKDEMNVQVHKRRLARKVPPVAIVTHGWRPLEDSMKELGSFLLNNWALDVEMDNLKPGMRPHGAQTLEKQVKSRELWRPCQDFLPLGRALVQSILYKPIESPAEGQCARRRLCQLGFTKGRRSLCQRFTVQPVEVCSRLCMNERARLAEMPCRTSDIDRSNEDVLPNYSTVCLGRSRPTS